MLAVSWLIASSLAVPDVSWGATELRLHLAGTNELVAGSLSTDPTPELAVLLPESLDAAPNGPLDETPDTVERPFSRWYGWQIALADATVATLALRADSMDGFAKGFLTLMVTGPFIHLFHGHLGRAAGSLGLRLSGLIWGLNVGQGDASTGTVFAGLILAEIVDLVFLARNDDELTKDESRSAAPPALAVTPLLGITRGGGLLGLGATF